MATAELHDRIKCFAIYSTNGKVGRNWALNCALHYIDRDFRRFVYGILVIAKTNKTWCIPCKIDQKDIDIYKQIKKLT